MENVTNCKQKPRVLLYISNLLTVKESTGTLHLHYLSIVMTSTKYYLPLMAVNISNLTSQLSVILRWRSFNYYEEEVSFQFQ